ncbi:nucleotide-binding protein, partial [Salmonella enterica]|nr:nucleotide-binding protein [Salmonella enterica]
MYTPCDTGSLAGEHTRKSRARQNVVFENGYLKLGCHNACALVTGDIEIP